ncbi:hypothetical protein CBS14141_000673 [Malassezia furfur]|nr:hypothetical protein CBS14141_000673 [Malassezia furfur]
MTGSTTLIVGLTVGLCVGMTVVVVLGVAAGVLVRRHWQKERQLSMDRAQGQLWHTDPRSSYLEKTWAYPTGDEEHTAHILYNVPESPTPFASDAQNASVHPGHPGLPDLPEEGVSPRTVPGPLPMMSMHEDDVRFPHAIAEQAQRPSVQWTRSTVPASLQSGNGTGPAPPQSRSASLRDKLSLSRSLSRSRSRMASIRLGSPTNQRSGNRRSVLSRFPSTFRSPRHSRRVTPSSQEEGSIGMPERDIPMARRIERGQTRFQYDSSSYGSSPDAGDGDWDEFIMDPAAAEIAMPAPAVLAAPRDAETYPDLFLRERISAWQESSVNAGVPGDEDVDAVPELRSHTHPAPLRRSTTQSTVQSAYSRASGDEADEELTNPYQQRSSQLMRIPSIRPQFAAETTLESWLTAEDPRVAQPSSSGHSSGLFAEVEFATAAGDSAMSESHTTPRDSLVVPVASADRLAPVLGAAGQRTSAYAPRTPSPLAIHSLVPAHPYEPSTSSRSSFPASARMSSDSPRDWKHRSNTTTSTQLTWPDEASLTADGSPGAALVKLERERSLRQAAADRVAQANRAWGVGKDGAAAGGDGDSDVPRVRERVLMPTARGGAPMPGRFSTASSHTSSESDSVNTEEGATHLSPLGTPVLGSPLQTIQAYFNHVPATGDKLDAVPFWTEDGVVSA